MKKLSSQQIRETWLSFYQAKGHSVEPSAPLVPKDDPTLLWNNAGVTPLKKYFDGRVVPNNKRITNVQKCIRTNDIENVGKTARHHTFFEMMGNFSIGDYFKDEVIPWAFELLTDSRWFGLPKDRLYMTIYPSDTRAKELWLSVGVEESHIIPVEGNFWQIGEGPSGPDTEIFFDRGEQYGQGGPEWIQNDIENDRYIEIWNIVFSQYNAKNGVPRDQYEELPHKNIDTGAGLERFALVLQGVRTNYDTDLFQPIIQKISEISQQPYHGEMAFQVIADHVRTVTFALSDGAVFSNEGRGYVLRRVLRRAVKYARQLGIHRPFMAELVDVVMEVMKGFYPYMVEHRDIVKQIITIEEEKFLKTIVKGEQKLSEMVEQTNILSGSEAFLLYDTYGFPIELTQEYCFEKDVEVDLEGFQKEMAEQKKRAREARKQTGSMNVQNEEYLNFFDQSIFVGYEKPQVKTTVIGVFEEGIVLEETPFYAISGGQVSDKGIIQDHVVLDVMKMPNGQHLHLLEDHPFQIGDVVEAKIDEAYRAQIRKNHSSAHLLHKALKEVLGAHVNQQGSQMTEEYCRFDFNHYTSLSSEILLQIEDLVNEKIQEAHPVVTHLKTILEAKSMNATALFEEKYEDVVRVVDMGWSMELCGGTHVKNTNEIEAFGIVSCESIGSGIFRITAVTGSNFMQKLEHSLKNIKAEIQTLLDKRTLLQQEVQVLSQQEIQSGLNETISSVGYRYVLDTHHLFDLLKEELKDYTKQIQEWKAKKAITNLEDYQNQVKDRTLVLQLEQYEADTLKTLVDALADKFQLRLIFVANCFSDKITFLCKTDGTIDAGKLVKEAAQMTGGNGGGRKDFAQAGGKDDTKLAEVFEMVHAIL